MYSRNLSVLFGLKVFSEIEVNSKTEGSIDELSEDGRVESPVELFDSTNAVELSDSVDEAGVATTLRVNLDAYLDHIHWLDAAGSSTGRQGTDEEVFVEVRHS